MNNTLAYLISQGYPSDKIFIFVANHEEAGRYYQCLPDRSYNRIIIGRKGLLEQRKFICDFVPQGAVMVQMDDDVKGLKILNPNETFQDIVRMGVDMLETQNLGLFGVMPNDDGRKLSPKTTAHLTHILGSFFIIRNRRDLLPTHEEKEDFERSILYYNAYGRVLRYQGAGVITKFRGTEGGLQQEGRAQREREGIANLVARYPDFVKRVEKPKGEDVVLNWRQPPSNRVGL